MNLPIEPMPVSKLQRYYRWQARLYDATRWSFLFGRRAVLEAAAARVTPRRILEVGCGTGTNLKWLAERFPQVKLTAVDLSEHMLVRARRKLARWQGRIEWQSGRYAEAAAEPFDLILFSYSLSMMNPGWEEALSVAEQDLSPGGLLVVVDFDDSPVPLFRRWMALNHVQVQGQLWRGLCARFDAVWSQQHRVYGGLWRYFMFVGRRAAPAVSVSTRP